MCSQLSHQTATQFHYRAAPGFAAPPCPVVLGVDCVALGPVAVDDVELRWFHNAIATTITITTKMAPMPHAARRPESVDRGGGSVTPMPHAARRAGSAAVRVIGSLRSSFVTGRAGSVYVRRVGSLGF